MHFTYRIPLGKEIIFSPETSYRWSESVEMNESLLSAIKSKAQAEFEACGYVFVNSILDMLGINRTSYGQLIGWSKKCGDEAVELRIEKFCQEGLKKYFYKLNFDNCNEIWYLIGTS